MKVVSCWLLVVGCCNCFTSVCLSLSLNFELDFDSSALTVQLTD